MKASNEELAQAATCIQSRWRGRGDRKMLAERKKKREEENKAATKIQARWRGKQSRDEIKKGGATKIDHQDRLIKSLRE